MKTHMSNNQRRIIIYILIAAFVGILMGVWFGYLTLPKSSVAYSLIYTTEATQDGDIVLLKVKPFTALKRQLKFIALHGKYITSDCGLTNPSIVRRISASKGYDIVARGICNGTMALYRVNDDMTEVETALGRSEKSNSTVCCNRQIEIGYEDARLFISATNQDTSAIYNTICHIDCSRRAMCVLSHAFSSTLGNSTCYVTDNKIEKNWSPVVSIDGMCHDMFVYSFHPKLKIIQISDEAESSPREIATGHGSSYDIHGGSQVIYVEDLGAYITIAHPRSSNHMYRSVLIVMDTQQDPSTFTKIPRSVLRQSPLWEIVEDTPFSCEKELAHACKIQYVSGLCMSCTDPEEIIMSYGLNDSDMNISSVSIQSLLDLVGLRMVSLQGYFINRGTDKLRRNTFEENSKDTGIQFQWWSATDKHDVQQKFTGAELMKEYPKWASSGVDASKLIPGFKILIDEPCGVWKGDDGRPSDLWGQIACSLSHMSLWSEIASKNDNKWYIICEDDCEFKKPSRHESWLDLLRELLLSAPSGADMLFLGTQEVWGDASIAWVKEIGWCTHCYAVHPRSASVLIEMAAQIGTGPAIDFLLRFRVHEVLECYSVSDSFLRHSHLLEQPNAHDTQPARDTGLAFQRGGIETTIT